MKQILNSERGLTLLVTLLVMVMLAMVTIIAVNTANNDMDLSFNQLHEEQAFYIAEAGAKRALLALKQDKTWRAGYTDVAFGDGAYTVGVLDSSVAAGMGDTIILRASATAFDAAALVELWVTPEPFHPFRFAMFADKGIAMDRYTCTDSYNSDSGTYAETRLDEEGTIGTNGTITAAQDVVIAGDASTATPDGISLGKNSTVTGDTTTSADSVNLNLIPDSEYAWAAANSNAPPGLSGAGYNYNGGSKQLIVGNGGTVRLEDGVYFFSRIETRQDARLEIAAGASVTIYVAGNIILNQGSSFNAGGSPVDMIIYSKGDSLRFDQDNVFNGAYYGPNAHIQYDQTTQVFGSLVGGSIKLDQDACFHYDRSLADLTKGTTDKLIVLGWRGP